MNGARAHFRTIFPWICGVLAALLWGGLVAIAIALATSIAGFYCAPQPECGKASRDDLVLGLAAAAALALMFGLAVRKLGAWRLDAAGVGGPPIWAVAVVTIFGLVALSIGSALFLS